MSDYLTTDRPFFFVHIMETAGMTFNAHIRNNFDRSAVYAARTTKRVRTTS